MDNETMQRHRPARNPDDLAAQIAPHLAAILALLAGTAAPTDADLLPLAEAARTAGTSVRVLRDAIRGGDLVAFGRQRDRSVRRVDLNAWIASRRVIHAPTDDRDLERRMARLAGAR